MKSIATIAAAALLLAGCSVAAAPDQAEAPAGTVAQEDAKPQAPAPAAIEAAKTALKAEPKVKDLTYSAADAVQWNIGVLDDGSRRVGYAQYVCSVLQEKGALAGRTHVRIVDIARVARGDDFRDANLGHVVCETGDVIDA